jgi:arylsulfatase A-like enzyme
VNATSSELVSEPFARVLNPFGMRTVVFILRGCPAGWLGAYGNEWVATPNLDRLAAESVIFDHHISDCPSPVAACASWLAKTRDEGTPIDSVLRKLYAASVHTLLVRANHPDTDAPDWFYDAWAEVFDARPQEEDKSPLDALIRTLPSVLLRLAAVPNFLLWIEIDRLLPPWDVPQDVFEAYMEDEDEEHTTNETPADEEADDSEDDGEVTVEDEPGQQDEVPAQEPEPTQQLRVPPWTDPPTGPFDISDPDAWQWLHSSFAAVVTTLDAELGVIFDQLRKHGFDQSATWLVTSDLGYPLGEHGQIGLHRPYLHEELVHLPLLLRLPGAAEACRRVSGFTQPADIATTLLDMAGLTPQKGISLLSLARGQAISARSYAVTALELNGASELAIRTPEWAYILPVKVPDGEVREPLLFEKPDDRWEVNDMRARNIERADELDAELKKATGHR